MTAHQLVDKTTKKILRNVQFEKDTTFKIVYLGQTEKCYFFVMIVNPVTATINEKNVKKAIQLLDEEGFEDLHWIHNIPNNDERYYYFMKITVEQ